MHEQLTEIEELCKKRVEKEFDRALWAEYEQARKEVFTNLLPYIRKNEPFLTDHGPDHITDVLDRAYDLLGKEQCAGKNSTKSLETAELYLLVLSILFHDVGNVFSRAGHKSRLQEAYEFAKGTDQSLAQERRLLFNIVGAHGGETRQGSPDTIGPLERQGLFRRKRVDCQRIAAILRFADELAEGIHRTSIFMQKHLNIPPDSKVYHDYATVTDINISPNDERIAVVYHLEMRPEIWGGTYDAPRLRSLLEFCFFRLQKLDLERRYNRHYCSLLNRFKRTEASFHFQYERQDLNLELEPIVLNDLVMPNRIDPNQIPAAFLDFRLDLLMARLDTAVNDLSVSRGFSGGSTNAT